MADRPISFLTRLFSEEDELAIAITAGVALAIGVPLWFWTPEPLATIGHALVWASLGIGGIHGLRAAWKALKELKPDIDLLMVVGAGLAAAIGHPEEGALLLFLFALAGALEHRALAKARDAVSRLHKLMPQNAMIRRGKDWEPIDPDQLAAGDEVLIRPGETIPADAIVIDGRSSIDQSSLTGESLPRPVNISDAIFAGTINHDGALEARVTRPVAESSIKRILKLVLEAQERRLPVQKVIDRFSTPYATTVFGVAACVFVFFAFFREGPGFSGAAYKAITLLVVASPCALVLATPTATLCGLSRAARAGVLIKGGDALERLATVRQVALDKTGTLTTGRIEVTHIQPVAGSDVNSLMSLALAAESRSTHPIAAAITRLAESYELQPADLASFTNVPGRGVEGSFEGKPVRIGTYVFCEPEIAMCFRNHTRHLADRIRDNGGMSVIIAHGGEALVLALADQPREGADSLARELRDVGVSSVTMLTGDHRVVAERVAAQLGIENVKSELLPEDKVEQVRRLKELPGGLAVIGDGVNDAPALAVADVGLAMGGIGADAALETADVVLLHDDLNRIPWSIALARRVKRVMTANLIFAIGVIAVLAALTLFSEIPLSLGVLGHEGSTLLVVGNSLRLLAHRDPAARASP